jgi:hypothetical protein
MSSECIDLMQVNPKTIAQLLDYLADENVVLVGGQAVMAWAYHYGIVQTDTSYTTDIDFFGTSADIEAADLRLIAVDHETRFANLEDSSPNSGVISIALPEQIKVRVDYLWAVYGLSGSDIQERSVPLQFPECNTPLRVLHPMMCLESKIVNLGAFPNKRDHDGVAQANAAIQIAKAYIQTLIEAGRERDALNATERVFRIAQIDSASFAWHIFDLDVSDAIPKQGLPKSFYVARLPQIENRLQMTRDALERRLPQEPTLTSTSTMRF